MGQSSSSASASSSVTVIVTSLPSTTPPLGSGAFHFRPSCLAVDRRLEVDADLLDVAERHDRAGDATGGGHRHALSFTVSVPSLLRTPSSTVSVDDSKTISGIPLGVEEVRREQVAGEPFVLDLQRGDLDPADELAVGQRGVDLAELAAEGADHHVADGKAGDGMDRINGPCAGGDLSCVEVFCVW